MPIHTYTCSQCKAEYDVFYTSQDAVKNEEKKEKCPNCKSTKKKRAVAKATTFVLKGKGWFKDGY